jgi:HAD superfamily hydrolase (TIGR01509 family)
VEWPTGMPRDVLRRRYFDRLSRAYARVEPAASASDVLSALRTRGSRLALVTSAAPELAYGLLDRLGWRQGFDAIVCGDAGRRGKPHPDPYLAALKHLAVAANDAVAVEDSVNGIRAAHGAGLRVIAVSGPNKQQSFLDAGALMVIGSLASLLSILE